MVAPDPREGFVLYVWILFIVNKEVFGAFIKGIALTLNGVFGLSHTRWNLPSVANSQVCYAP